jgi:PelA/Pel-15E family pectate lyase
VVALAFAAGMHATGASGQRPTQPVAWQDVLRQPAGWYGSAEARGIADFVLQHQRKSGGWPKEADMTRAPARDSLAAAALHPDSTLDNGATMTQIRLLVLVSRATGVPRYRNALIRGLDYLLDAQYPNGGWPQFFPLRTDYSRYITFNDNAMIGAMTILDEVSRGVAPLDGMDDTRRAKARTAVARGVEVILASQIRVDGRLTAWCAQHDEATFVPRGARTYEHPSISGQESVGIVRFLMSRDGADARIVAAVDAAVAWFRTVRLPGDPPRWARFYQIGTNRPIFSGRDGIVRYKLEEIEEERRNNYAWLGSWPQRLVDVEYPDWQRRHRAKALE